jgi:hypothetical protein
VVKPKKAGPKAGPKPKGKKPSQAADEGSKDA